MAHCACSHSTPKFQQCQVLSHFVGQHHPPRNCYHLHPRTGRNLGLLWRRAFLGGVEQGIAKAKLAMNQQLEDANLEGFQDGYDQGCDEAEEFSRHYEDQLNRALQGERSKWKGHGDTCFEIPVSPSTRESAVQSDPIRLPPTISLSTQTPPHSIAMATVQVDTPKTPPHTTTMAAVQVDTLNPPPPHVEVQADIPRSTANSAVQTVPLGTQYTSSQTSPPPSPIPDPIHITARLSPPLSWADDIATSLSSLIPPTAPHDLSCLRSEKIHPFGALCQRDRRTQRQPRKS